MGGKRGCGRQYIRALRAVCSLAGHNCICGQCWALPVFVAWRSIRFFLLLLPYLTSILIPLGLSRYDVRDRDAARAHQLGHTQAIAIKYPVINNPQSPVTLTLATLTCEGPGKILYLGSYLKVP